MLTQWVTKKMKYDSIICQLNKVLKKIRDIKCYIFISSVIYKMSRTELRLNPHLNLEGEKGYMMHVTIKVAVKSTNMSQMWEETILEDSIIVWTHKLKY